MESRNHEGYHDPTACKAIRNAFRKRRKPRLNGPRLMYRLEEIRAFQRVKIDT